MDRTSLVVVEAGEDAQPRLAMLDTVREFAAEQVAQASCRGSNSGTRATSSTYAERAAEQAARADRRTWLAPPRARARQPAGRVRAPAARGAADDALRIAIAFARALPWDAHAHEVRGWLAAGARRACRRNRARYALRRSTGTSSSRSPSVGFAAAQAPLEQALAAARALEDRELGGRGADGARPRRPS